MYDMDPQNQNRNKWLDVLTYVISALLIVGAIALLLITNTGCVQPCETPVPTPTATPIPGIDVRTDPRIHDFLGDGPLNVKLYPCDDCRYKVIEIFITVDGIFDGAPDWAWDYVGIDGAGGATHTFAVVKKFDGLPLNNKTVVLSWPGTEVGGKTKSDGSVNWFTNCIYFPDQGQTGPYCVQPLNGEKVCGGGLPYNVHVSLWVVYESQWPDTAFDVILGAFGIVD